jgi:hypothetical protein
VKIVSGSKGISTRPKEKTAFAWELAMDFYDCDLTVVSNQKKIQHFAEELCKMLDIKTYGEPVTPYFEENLEHGRGFAFIQFMESGSISGHFSESMRSSYINLFSTRLFDPDPVEKFTKTFFSAKRMSSRFIIRR